MLLRVLTMHVRPDKLDAWMVFTRDTGFPGMLAQPGCRSIWRLRGHGDPPAFKVMTLWDSLADLERFRASPDLGQLGRASAHLVSGPADEELYDVLPDPPR